MSHITNSPVSKEQQQQKQSEINTKEEIKLNIVSDFTTTNKLSNNLNNSNISNNSNMTTSSLKEPKTPSLPKFSSFSSPSVVVLPETPERIPRHINDLEDTPLLSPPHSRTPLHSNLNSNSSPQKQRNNNNNSSSTDFYTLLKSPARSTDDNKLKRRSMELFGITNGTKSPEQIHKEYDNDHLLKSPRRNYKEIRKISENLRTRLNYANIKVQHGWSNKSIGELEHSLEEIASNPQISAQLNSNKNLEDFWNLRTDNLPNKLNINNENNNLNVLSNSPGKFINNSPKKGRRSSFVSNIRLDDIAKRNSKTSPELSSSSEFLPYSMSNTTSNNSTLHGLQNSPIKKDILVEKHIKKDKTKLSLSTKNSDSLEQDAIMSLISLSSPLKHNGSASLSPSPPRHSSISGSPTRSSHSRLPSLSGISNKRLPPLPATFQPPLSAPGIMVSSSDSNVITFDRSSDKRYILPNLPNFENRGLGMGNININNNNNNRSFNLSSSNNENLSYQSSNHHNKDLNNKDNNNIKYSYQHSHQHIHKHSHSNSHSHNHDDTDETDDETTEDEMVDYGVTHNKNNLSKEDNLPTITNDGYNMNNHERGQYHEHHESDSIINNNNNNNNNNNKKSDIFRTTKFDGVKMTSKKGK